MESQKEFEALQNFAKSLNLKVNQKINYDKRIKKNYYFLSYNGESISPVLDYGNLNSFMIGYENCKKIVLSQLNSI